MVIKGSTHSEETRAKIADGLKGHIVSAETREKIAAALRKEEAPCSMEGCGRTAVARGLCPMHYHRLQRYGDPNFRKRVPKKIPASRLCTIEGCSKFHYGLGWCRPHYDRARRTGDPGPPTFQRRHRMTEAERLERRRRYWLKSMYGTTPETYESMLAAQGGGCAICGSTEVGGHPRNKYFPVDHCHETGVVRGLLCVPCNTALGRFRDDPATLRHAIRYLERLT